jgi:hypothetical protein
MQGAEALALRQGDLIVMMKAKANRRSRDPGGGFFAPD